METMSATCFGGGVETINSIFDRGANVPSFHKGLFISTIGDEEDVLLEPFTKGNKASLIMTQGVGKNILYVRKRYHGHGSGSRIYYI